MAGILLQGFKKALEKIVTDKIEKFWPMVQYLVENKVLVPALIGVGTVAGYYFDYFIGNTMGIVAVAALVVLYIVRLLITKGKK